MHLTNHKRPVAVAARRRIRAFASGVWCLLSLIVFAGCTVITDFDESRIKLNLHEVLMDEYIQIRTIADVGVITLHFSEPFSSDDIDTFDALFGNEVALDLAVDGTSTGNQITARRVTQTPQHPGEFQLMVGAGGENALIIFYNGDQDNRIVQPGDAVELVIHVGDNPLIVADAYAYDASVQIDPEN